MQEYIGKEDLFSQCGVALYIARLLSTQGGECDTWIAEVLDAYFCLLCTRIYLLGRHVTWPDASHSLLH